MGLRLEVFDHDALEGPAGDVIITNVAAFDHAKAAAFAAGFAAGEAAQRQLATAEKQAGDAALMENLHSLSLSWHEARGHLLRDLQPVLSDLALILLPPIAQQVLGPQICRVFAELAQQASDPRPSLRLHPDRVVQIEAYLAAAGPPGLQILPDTSLSPDEAYLQLSSCRQHLDLAAALTAITTAISDFFALSQEVSDEQSGPEFSLRAGTD